MAFDRVWEGLREQCESLDSESVLVTPGSERAFIIDSSTDDRIDIRFVDGGRERPLWRDQFAVLDDQLTSDSTDLDLSGLAVGVEPYVSVLSLADVYEVNETDNVLRRVESGTAQQSPFVRPRWAARSRQERIRDDALLLVEQLKRHSFEDLSDRSDDELADAYVLLSDVQRGANRLRQRLGNELLARIGPDDRLHGQFGTVRRTRRERRRLKEQEVVYDAVDELGIPREWIIGVDQDKLDVVLTVTDLDESTVYDIEDQIYVQKTAVEEDAKQSRLQGLADRLDAFDSDEATELQRDLEQLEIRIEDLLATS